MKTRYSILIILLVVTGFIMTSCYKEFDPNSYKPPFTINGFSSVNQIKPGNLVAYWAFEGGLTDSVSGANATNSGCTFANGFIGKALSLNVANKAYAQFNPTPALTTSLESFTISFWVNPTFVDKNSDNAIDGILGFVSLSNVNKFWGNIDWFLENGSGPSGSKIVIHITSDTLETWVNKAGITGLFGSWSSHTLTYDAATSQLTYYINGSVAIPATTVPWTGAVNFTGSGPYVFGCAQFQTNPSCTSATGAQDWASYLTGFMDEVRIYNTALTATEVNSLVVLQGKN